MEDKNKPAAQPHGDVSLADKGDMPSERPQGETVCYLVNDRFGGKAYLEEGSEALAIRRRLGFTDEIPLYAEQPAPVAVVLPERRPEDYPSPRTRDAWNACLDELKRLNPSL